MDWSVPNALAEAGLQSGQFLKSSSVSKNTPYSTRTKKVAGRNSGREAGGKGDESLTKVTSGTCATVKTSNITLVGWKTMLKNARKKPVNTACKLTRKLERQRKGQVGKRGEETKENDKEEVQTLQQDRLVKRRW